MPHVSLNSPVGFLTLFEEDDAIVALEWGRVPGGEETPLLRRASEQLRSYFDGDAISFSLPLSPRGTSFQQRVWAQLSGIVYGATRTYGDIARDLETFPRAVAGACARNPIPLIIPCHRVVAAAGGLGGFSGGDGPETKVALLRLEGCLPTPLL